MIWRLSTVGSLVLGLLCAPLFEPAIAQAVDVLPAGELNDEPDDEPTEQADDSTAETADYETANYSDGKLSIDYPATWEVEVNEAGEIAIANIAQTPVDLVETTLYRVDAPPGPLVDANIDSFIAEGSAVSRYRSVTIDEQSALVMWLADRPGQLSSAIATFIGYGDETILLFSSYSPENATAEATILNLHGSFSNLALVSGSESATEDEPLEIDLSEDTTTPEAEKPVLPTDELPLQNEEVPIQNEGF
ncbi:MAG: hypothetical protein AAF810_05110 [Cyanobacteria bacterium P01_D01_bin.36]